MGLKKRLGVVAGTTVLALALWSGVAFARIEQSAKGINFPNTAASTVSSEVSLVITNAGRRAISLGTAQFPPSDFGYNPNNSTCDNLTTLAAATSCSWALVFVPSSTGLKTGTFVQPTGGRDVKVALSGTGV